MQLVQQALLSTQREPESQLRAFRLVLGQKAHSPSLATAALRIPTPMKLDAVTAWDACLLDVTLQMPCQHTLGRAR